MSSMIGKNFRVYNAEAFARSFSFISTYLYVGKVSSWEDDDSPPAPEDHPAYHNSVKNKMVGLKRIGPDEVRLGAKRYDWTSGNRYERYKSANASLGDTNPYYVLAGYNDRSVYKCLDNNGNSVSTSKPSHKNLGATRELDGYIWKYMYTITEADFKKFATADVIPVGSDGTVWNASLPSSIINVPISANNTTGIGSYYRGLGVVNTTYAASAVNATIFTTVAANTTTNELRIIADSGFSRVDNYYNNSAFYITSGTAAGTYRRIIDSKVVTGDTVSNLVFSGTVTSISNGDTFIIGPSVTANTTGIDGSGFLGIAKTNRYGNVTSIEMSMVGGGFSNGYSNVFVNGLYATTSENSPNGTGAEAEIPIPPSGGHGSNIPDEIESKYVIVAPETVLARDHQTGTFIGYGNDIRQIGLLMNPVESSTGRVAINSSYDMRTVLYFANPTNLGFKVDQRIYNSATEGQETATGLVYNICGSSSDQYLTLVDTTGQFANGDIIYNRIGESAIISSSSLQNHEYPLGSGVVPRNSVISGGIAKYTGDIIYHENISPITRRLDQKEEFKFVFEF